MLQEESMCFLIRTPMLVIPNPLKEGQELFRKGLLSYSCHDACTRSADLGNLEVLLALGVSHTNELEQAAALKYLYSWLSHHPKYKELAFQEPSNSLHYADVTNLFNEAAKLAPDDADVHIVLGVLYNLSREFDKAMEAFENALKLRPRDYSLWNKLGATQANSIHSADAV
ncbi:hypothetical protein QQ045_002627 [Rhodiola kirilowii]